MAEIKTVRKIIATTDVIAIRAKAEIRQHARDIHEGSGILEKKIGLAGSGSGWKEAQTKR